MSRFYGDAVANSFRLQRVPSIVVQSGRGAPISASRISVGAAQMGMSPRIPAEDTFILALYLKDVPHHELWRGGRKWIAQGYTANSMRIVNLADDLSANITHPHESVSFYIPRPALDDLAEEEDFGTVRHLECLPGTKDPVVQQIVALLSPAMARPDRANSLYTDHLVLALCAHLAHAYGAAAQRPAERLGRPQVRRAMDYMASHCQDDITLADVARQCGLSRAYFAASFKRATGYSPHRWLQSCRIDRAKALLATSRASIAEIAVLCGFADQSHLTRVFTRLAGSTPAAWRRRAQS